jgi:hypothetical protein
MASEDRKVSDDDIERLNVPAIVQIHIAEFHQLREEINRYHDHQKEEVYFAMLVLGGIFAMLLSPNIALYPEVFLVLPFLFSSLAFAYVDRTIRILRIATYIHQCLRENLVRELETLRLLQWEIFKKYRVVKSKERVKAIKPSCFQDKLLLWVKRNVPEIPLLLDYMRVAQFVTPSILSISLFAFMNKKPWDFVLVLIMFLVIVVALLPVYFFIRAEETSGIQLVSERVDLAQWEKDWRSRYEQTK